MGDEALHILLTPLYITSLQLILRKKVRAQPECFQWTKDWIRDITEGLSHLHLQGVCHLNLEPSNIFIGSNRIAAIGDFDCIQSTTRPTNTFGPLSQYSPPECWSDSSEYERPYIEGIPHDLWSLGMVALHVWANHPLDTKLWDRKNWIDLFPSIFKALQINIFKKLVTRAFPNSNINEVEVLSCLNFLRGLLHTDPMKRPITSRVLEHQVLQGGIWPRLDTWFVCDPTWDTQSDWERGRGDNIVQGKSSESSQIDASGVCEESRSTRASNVTSEASLHGTHGGGEESLPTRESIEVTPDSPEEGVSRPASNRRARVRGWLRKRWKRVKAFFCCETSID